MIEGHDLPDGYAVMVVGHQPHLSWLSHGSSKGAAAGPQLRGTHRRGGADLYRRAVQTQT